MLKVHADIVEDRDTGTGPALAEFAKRHHFMIFVERKFVDIDRTVKNQVCGDIPQPCAVGRYCQCSFRPRYRGFQRL